MKNLLVKEGLGSDAAYAGQSLHSAHPRRARRQSGACNLPL